MGEERYTMEPGPGVARRESGGSVDPPAVTASAPESELAARYWERLRMVAMRRLRDGAAAEDVAQETLRRVVEALRAGRVHSLEALPGFVFQTAHHICLQRERSARRESRALTRWVAPDAPPDADALLALITAERRSAVRHALAQLEEGDRTLLRMLYFDRIDSSVVAERLAVTPGALRVRKHRALLRLSALLAGVEP